MNENMGSHLFRDCGHTVPKEPTLKAMSSTHSLHLPHGAFSQEPENRAPHRVEGSGSQFPLAPPVLTGFGQAFPSYRISFQNLCWKLPRHLPVENRMAVATGEHPQLPTQAWRHQPRSQRAQLQERLPQTRRETPANEENRHCHLKPPLIGSVEKRAFSLLEPAAQNINVNNTMGTISCSFMPPCSHNQ